MQLLTLNVKRSTAHPEEILDKYWTKAVDYGAARLEKKRKTAEKIHGYSEGGHADCWYDRGGW